jgi:hypothetical protein
MMESLVMVLSVTVVLVSALVLSDWIYGDAEDDTE